MDKAAGSDTEHRLIPAVPVQHQTMDDLRFRLNFNLSKKNEIYHHS